jgi:hypothetical protein
MTCKYPSTLREKVIGLREARDRTATQKQLEKTREEQEDVIIRNTRVEDVMIDREHKVGKSAVTISIAGIITVIIAHRARRQIVNLQKLCVIHSKSGQKHWGPILVQ